MKKMEIFTLLALITMMSGCQLAGDIFKAGIWSGIILVALGIGLVLFIITRISR